MEHMDKQNKYLIFLIVLYVFYLGFFSALINLDSLICLDWKIFLKLFVIVFIVYIYIYNKYKRKFALIDYYALFIPFFFWLVLTSVFGGKSGTNFLIVEFPIVGILSGLYYIKFPIISRYQIKKPVYISVVLLIAICILISVMYFLLPSLPE
jgi:hypothetical protein